MNTPTAITPHAFLGKFEDIKNDKSVASGVDAISGPHRQFYPPSPTALNSMSLEAFRSEINRHLCGKNNLVSHFSSWTADLQTAIRYACATAQEARWGSCTDTALYLTIIAAEWSQEVIEWAARDASLVLPLVNPHTHQTDLPEVALMIKILMNFEDEIIKLRSNPQPKPWSLTRFLWG
ncbi:hypothetical protein LA080_015816 [Diaporthe eres]|nr:hypothetical protein LA080_015816 [Diaporthe eres]